MESRKPETMVESVSSALRAVWWLPLLRGLALLILGVLVVMDPLETLVILSRITAVFLLVDAVIVILQGLLNRTQTGWRMWLVQGLVDLVFALLILFWPGLTVLIFFYLLVVWTIALGAVAIASSAALARNKDLSWPWLLAFGLLSVLFGAMLLLRSGDDVARTIELVGLVLGIYAFIAGAIQIVSAFSVRTVARDIDDALRGNSPVLNAINFREEAYAENKAEREAERAQEREEAKIEKAAEKEKRAAERAAEREEAKAEKAAEKEQRAAEKAQEHADAVAAKHHEATPHPATPRSEAEDAAELARHNAQLSAQAHDMLATTRPVHSHDDPNLTMFDEPLLADSHHTVAEPEVSGVIPDVPETRAARRQASLGAADGLQGAPATTPAPDAIVEPAGNGEPIEADSGNSGSSPEPLVIDQTDGNENDPRKDV